MRRCRKGAGVGGASILAGRDDFTCPDTLLGTVQPTERPETSRRYRASNGSSGDNLTAVGTPVADSGFSRLEMRSPRSKAEQTGSSPSASTPLLEFSARRLASDGQSEEKMIAAFGRAHPIGRVGKVSETSALIAYLCSDATGFTTGADFLIDGGLSARIGV